MIFFVRKPNLIKKSYLTHKLLLLLLVFGLKGPDPRLVLHNHRLQLPEEIKYEVSISLCVNVLKMYLKEYLCVIDTKLSHCSEFLTIAPDF